jgi:hypothetical protein
MSVSTLAAAQSEVTQFEVLLEVLPGEVGTSARLLIPFESGLREAREGAGIFECLGDVPGDDAFSIQCYHSSLAGMVARETELAEQGLLGAAFRERICKDFAAGSVDIPDRTYLVTASGRRGANGGLPDSVAVSHYLYLPFATQVSTGLPSVEVSPGSPYLHRGGSCTAHVMWSETRSAIR